jgi:hypothetical protein
VCQRARTELLSEAHAFYNTFLQHFCLRARILPHMCLSAREKRGKLFFHIFSYFFSCAASVASEHAQSADSSSNDWHKSGANARDSKRAQHAHSTHASAVRDEPSHTDANWKGRCSVKLALVQKYKY